MASKGTRLVTAEPEVRVVRPRGGGSRRKGSDGDPTVPRNDPSTSGLFHTEMDPIWAKIGTIMAGTDAMRAAGETYLPRHAKEPSDAYSERLATNVLNNALDRTVNFLADKPFTEEITFEPSFPVELKPLMENLDGQGSDISKFAHEGFKIALAFGYSHVITDAPANVGTTLADQRDSGARPYLEHIDPRSVIGARVERVNDREEYTHFRYYDAAVVQDGFEERVETTIRVLDLAFPEELDPRNVVMTLEDRRVRVSVYSPKEVNGRTVWLLREEPMWTDQPRIMIRTFYTARDGTLCCKPVLSDAADLNITHWQSSSDQRAILTLSRFAILCVSGISDAEGEDGQTTPISIGPNQVLSTDNPEAKYYYVEASGSGLEAGAKDLADLEAKIAEYGLKLLEKRPDRETAKSRELDEEGTTAPLQAMVRAYMDYWKLVLTDMQFMETGTSSQKEDIGGIVIKTDFASGADTPSIQLINSLINSHQLSSESGFEMLKEMKVVPASFDIAKNFTRLEKELPLVKEYAVALRPPAATPSSGATEQAGDSNAAKDKNSPGAPKS